ncbi:M23 family metallopeptidase [Amycolatopsis nigrescens]|uniref:M23 family metallopeptidase n=1 Tax=Amycolatopsis nigrescens TaxID=381445 RepID=UPI00058BD421|nr:M23 family metallopeptidase [Amycolatopsis nigrescens]
MVRTAAVGVVFAGTLIAVPLTAGADQTAAAFPTFGLPFAAGQETGSAGIHSDDGTSGVKNAIDLNPVDGTVRAPLAGTAHLQHCDGGDWVTVDHEDGWRTGYYHMEGIQVTDGQQVEAGTPLGSIGNALPCGGSSTGAHVHFTLFKLSGTTARSADPVAAGNWDGLSYRQISGEVAAAVGEPVDGKVFGGWLFNEGSGQYSGTATRVRDESVVKLPGRFKYEG